MSHEVTPDGVFIVHCDDCSASIQTNEINVFSALRYARQFGWIHVRRSFNDADAFVWRPVLRKFLCPECRDRLRAQKQLAA